MRVLIYIVVGISLIACNSNTQPKVEVEKIVPPTPVDSASIKTTKLFTAATSEYIKEFYKKDKPDTLFLSRNPEFPGITLPNTIEQIPIRIIDTEEGHTIAKRRPMTILNLIDLGGNEFMIVTFENGFNPQFNSQLYFKFTNNEFKLDSLKTTCPYEKTRTRSH